MILQPVKTKLTQACVEAYSYNSNWTSVQEPRLIKEENVKFTVDQVVDIPPCSEYRASSYVKVTQKISVDYVAHVLFRGRKDSRRMTTTELNDNLTEMDFDSGYDEFTITAAANGTIRADLEINSCVDAQGLGVHGCRTK